MLTAFACVLSFFLIMGLLAVVSEHYAPPISTEPTEQEHN
jgi:hypothetical protein